MDEDGKDGEEECWVSRNVAARHRLQPHLIVGLEKDGDLKQACQGSEFDPLYDPEADSDDEAWAATMYGKGFSDAVLCCSGCFTPLCYACKSFTENGRTRYQAMHYVNCVKEECLKKRRRLSPPRAQVSSEAEDDKASNPPVMLKCAECGHIVGHTESKTGGVATFADVLPSGPSFG